MSFLLSGMILAICWQLIVTFAALGQLVVKLGLSSWHACPHSFSFTAFCCSNFGLELRLNGALIHAVRSWASPFGVPLVPENWLTTIINVKSEQVFVRHACSAPPKKELFETPVDLRSTQTYSDPLVTNLETVWLTGPCDGGAVCTGLWWGTLHSRPNDTIADELGICIPDFQVTLVRWKDRFEIRFDINL